MMTLGLVVQAYCPSYGMLSWRKEKFKASLGYGVSPKAAWTTG